MCLLQGEGVQCTTAFYCSAPAPPLSVVFRFAYSCSLSVAAMVGFHTKFTFAHHGWLSHQVHQAVYAMMGVARVCKSLESDYGML